MLKAPVQEACRSVECSEFRIWFVRFFREVLRDDAWTSVLELSLRTHGFVQKPKQTDLWSVGGSVLCGMYTPTHLIAVPKP